MFESFMQLALENHICGKSIIPYPFLSWIVSFYKQQLANTLKLQGCIHASKTDSAHLFWAHVRNRNYGVNVHFTFTWQKNGLSRLTGLLRSFWYFQLLLFRCEPGVKSDFQMAHSDLFSEFWFSESFRGYTAHIWLSSIPLVFLGVKDFRKNEKGQQRSWRPNKGQRVNNV